MKKLLTILMTLSLFITSNAAIANDVGSLFKFDSKEEFFKDFDKKMDASKKQIKKILKKDDAYLEKNFGKQVQLLKNDQEELLLDLGLDQVSTTREVVETMATDEAQAVILTHIENKIFEAGGFDSFKEKVNSNQKGFFSDVFRGLFRAVGTVLLWIFVYPIMVLMVLTGAWY